MGFLGAAPKAKAKLHTRADCMRLADELGAEIELMKPEHHTSLWEATAAAPDGFVWSDTNYRDLFVTGLMKRDFPRSPNPEMWDTLYRAMAVGIEEDPDYEADE